MKYDPNPLTPETVKKLQKQAAAAVASLTLASLRGIRDNNPKEYDALMATESGQTLTSLWDYLRSVEKDTD
jgi:hypothetical protein